MPESFKEDGRPAQQWYWDDWFASFDVRLCSLAARGLWIDMLGIMFKAEIRGTLTVNGKQINGKTLAKITGDTEQDVNECLKELEDNDVFSRLEDNTIINRRMFNRSSKKDYISNIRSEAGKKGAESRWQNGSKKDDKNMAKMATSSSTSSPSSSPTNIEDDNTSSSCLKKISDYHLGIAELLEKKIKERIPKHKFIGNYLNNWANTVRLMEEKDKLSIPEIDILICWIFENQFWYKNILSMDKLREKFGRLWAQMEDEQPKRDAIGKDKKREQTEKDKQFKQEYEKRRQELEKKYQHEFEKAQKDGSLKMIGEVNNKIKQELAEWSNEYWKEEQ